MSLQDIIVEKLKELGLTLGIVETSTCGMISSNIATLKNFEEVYNTGLIINNKKINWRFGFDDVNFISQNNARAAAKYLHDEYNCDVVLSVISTRNDAELTDLPNLTIDEKYKNNPNSHAFISVLVIDRYTDFELKFKYENEMRHRMTISAKAINELISILIKLK